MPRQRRAGVGGHPDRGLAPDQGTLPEVFQRAHHVGFGSAVADQRQQLCGRHWRGVGLQHQQCVEHGQPQEFELIGGSLDDCRATARAASAAMLPGGGWARSGRSFEQPDQPLVGQVGKPGPSGISGVLSVIADQRKAASGPRGHGEHAGIEHLRPSVTSARATCQNGPRGRHCLRTRRAKPGTSTTAGRRRIPTTTAVSDLATHRTGALSPFGELTFPLPSDYPPYVHPVTDVNR